MSQIYAPDEKVLVGLCRQSHVVDPFQYFAQAGERIVAIQTLSHEGLSREYVHLDREGVELTRLSFSKAPSRTDQIGHAAIFGDEVFDHLMRELHLNAMAANKRWDADQVAAVDAELALPAIVVGGCGRSGTTLLLSILGAHPSICAFPDEKFLFFPYPFRLGRFHVDLERERQPAHKRWAEKTPKNVQAFGSILKAFKDRVRLIHVIRDGRDVVTSHHPNHNLQYWVSPERWVADVRAGLDFFEQSLVVKYEELLREPRSTIQRICDYIEEPFDERMLHPELHSTVQTNVAWEGGEIKPLHSRVIERWKDEVNKERVAKFMEYPGVEDLMKRLGYLS